MKRKGFAVLEFVVVIAIIAIIAGVTVPKIQNATDNSDKTKDLTNARLIGEAVIEMIQKEDNLAKVAGIYRFEDSGAIAIGKTSDQTDFATQLNKELKQAKFTPEFRGTLPTARSFILEIDRGGAIEVSVGDSSATAAGPIILFPKIHPNYLSNE